MKKNFGFLIFVAVALFFAVGCSNEHPTPKHPVAYSGIPRETVKITGCGKTGEFIIGYRIVTDEYIITSGYGGLFGQEGQALGGPGAVPYATVSTFGHVVEVAKQIRNKEPMTFYGDLAYTREGNKPYLFEGKKVIILFKAKYDHYEYKVAQLP